MAFYRGEGAYPVPQAMSETEIMEAIRGFADAAARAREAGFDGVEIHGANGYLIDQFLRDGTNHRTDGYGGSVANRARLLREVTEAVLTVWEAGRVGVRLSPVNAFNDIADSMPQSTFEAITEQLNAYGLAYLHVVEDPSSSFDFQKLRQIFNGAYMANGDYDRARATAAIAREQADFIAFGKLFIANPDLPERLRRDGPYNTPRPESFYAGGPEGYDDYPALETAVA